MKVVDLTPRMIGKHIRIESTKMRIEGELRRFQPDIIIGLGKPDELVGMNVQLDNHQLRLTGWENCAIVKGPK